MRSTKESVVLIRLGCLSCPRALASATSFMFHTSVQSQVRREREEDQRSFSLRGGLVQGSEGREEERRGGGGGPNTHEG